MRQQTTLIGTVKRLTTKPNSDELTLIVTITIEVDINDPSPILPLFKIIGVPSEVTFRSLQIGMDI